MITKRTLVAEFAESLDALLTDSQLAELVQGQGGISVTFHFDGGELSSTIKEKEIGRDQQKEKH